MANKYRGMVAIQLDKARNLRFGTNAIVQAEELLGFRITEMQARTAGMTELRILLWAGLKHEQKDLTLDEAGDLLDEAEDFKELGDKLKEALQLAFKMQAKQQGTEQPGN